MFETFFANVLQRSIGVYFVDLGTSDIRIGVWNGDVNISNLIINPEAFACSTSALSLVAGSVSKISIKIPWYSSFRQPCNIFVDRLELQFRLKDDDSMAMSDFKKEVFLFFHKHFQAERGNDEGTYLKYFKAKALDSCNFFVKNVEIVIERNPGRVCFGITSLSLLSSNDAANGPAMAGFGSKLASRAFSIDNITCSFSNNAGVEALTLLNITALNAIITPKSMDQESGHALDLLIDSISIELNTEFIQNGRKFIDDLQAKRISFRSLVTSVLKEQRRGAYAWDTIASFCNDRRSYVCHYNAKPTVQSLQVLFALEQKHDLQDVLFFRSIANVVQLRSVAPSPGRFRIFSWTKPSESDAECASRERVEKPKMLWITSKVQKSACSLCVTTGHGVMAKFTFELFPLLFTGECASNWTKVSFKSHVDDIVLGFQSFNGGEEKILFQEKTTVEGLSTIDGEAEVPKNILTYDSDVLQLDVIPITLALNADVIMALQSAWDALSSLVSFSSGNEVANCSPFKLIFLLQLLHISLDLFHGEESLMLSIFNAETVLNKNGDLDLSLCSISSFFRGAGNQEHDALLLLKVSHCTGKLKNYAVEMSISEVFMGIYDYPIWMIKKALAPFESSSPGKVADFELLLKIDAISSKFFYASKCAESSSWSIAEETGCGVKLCFTFESLCELKTSSCIAKFLPTTKEHLTITFMEHFELAFSGGDLLFVEDKQPPEAFRNQFLHPYVCDAGGTEHQFFLRSSHASSQMDIIFKKSDVYTLSLNVILEGGIASSLCPEVIINLYAYLGRLFVFNLFAPAFCSSFFCFPATDQKRTKLQICCVVKNSTCKLLLHHRHPIHQLLFIDEGTISIEYEKETTSILSKKSIEVTLNAGSSLRSSSGDDVLISWMKPLNIRYVSPTSSQDVKSYVQELVVTSENILLHYSQADLRDLVLFKEKIIHYVNIFSFQLDCCLGLASPCHTMTTLVRMVFSHKNELVLPSAIFEASYPFEFSMSPSATLCVTFSTFQFQSSSDSLAIETLIEDEGTSSSSSSTLRVNINDLKLADESLLLGPFTLDILLNNARSMVDVHEPLAFKINGTRVKSMSLFLCFFMEFTQTVPMILEGGGGMFSSPHKRTIDFVVCCNIDRIILDVVNTHRDSILLSMLNCIIHMFSSGGRMDLFYFFAGYSLKYKNYSLVEADIAIPSFVDKNMLIFDAGILETLVNGSGQIYCSKDLSLYMSMSIMGQFSSERLTPHNDGTFCIESVQKLNFFVPFLFKIYDVLVLHQLFNFITSSIPKKDLEVVMLDPKQPPFSSSAPFNIDNITLSSQISVDFFKGIYVFMPFGSSMGSFYFSCTNMHFASHSKVFMTPREEGEYFRSCLTISGFCFNIDPTLKLGSEGDGMMMMLIGDSHHFPSLIHGPHRKIISPVCLTFSMDGKRKHSSLVEIWSKIELPSLHVNITSNDILLLEHFASTLSTKMKNGDWMISSRGNVPSIDLVNQIAISMEGMEILVIFEDYGGKEEELQCLSAKNGGGQKSLPSLTYSCPFLKIAIPKVAVKEAYLKVESVKLSEDEEEEQTSLDPHDIHGDDDSNLIRFEDDSSSSHSEFLSDLSDDICDLCLSFTMDLEVNFFNSDNSTWEPLVEGWQFSAALDRRWLRGLNMTTSTEISISSTRNLEICISRVFLKYASLYLRRIISLYKDIDMVVANSRSQSAHSAHGQNLTFLIKNETGVDLMLWSNDDVIAAADASSSEPMGSSSSPETTEICDRLHAGNSLYWRFSSSQDPILNVHLLEERFPFESIRSIPVNKHLSAPFLLRPSIDGVKHFVIVEVSSYDLMSRTIGDVRAPLLPASLRGGISIGTTTTRAGTAIANTSEHSMEGGVMGADSYVTSFALHDPITYAKRIDIRSALQLQNHTEIVFEVMFFIPDKIFHGRELASFLVPQIYIIECWPGEIQGVPLDIAYHARFKIRPKYFSEKGAGNKESDEGLFSPTRGGGGRGSIHSLPKCSPINTVRYIWSAASVDWRAMMSGCSGSEGHGSTLLSALDVELISNPDFSGFPDDESGGSISQVFSVSTIVHCERLGDLYLPHPAMRCHFVPPVIINSQLPYPITFKILDRRQKVNFKASLTSYETLHLHYVTLAITEDADGGPALLGLMVEIPAIGCASRGPSLIYHSGEAASRRSTKASKYGAEQRTKADQRGKTMETEQSPYVDDFIELMDENGLPLVLRINYRSFEYSSVVKQIEIYAPYLVLNQSELDISLRQVSTILQGGNGEKKHYAIGSKDRSSASSPSGFPLLYSYGRQSGALNNLLKSSQARSVLRTRETEWSKPISMEIIGSSQHLELHGRSISYQLGISISTDPRTPNSKVIIVRPRFVLYSMVNFDFGIAAASSPSDVNVISPGALIPFHFSRWSKGESHDSIISYAVVLKRISSPQDCWSAPLILTQLGASFLRFERSDDTAIVVGGGSMDANLSLETRTTHAADGAIPSLGEREQVEDGSATCMEEPLSPTTSFGLSPLLKCQVLMEGPTIYAVFSTQQDYPFVLVNKCPNHSLTCHQVGSHRLYYLPTEKIESTNSITTSSQPMDNDDADLNTSSRRMAKSGWRSTVPFFWEMPSIAEKKLVIYLDDAAKKKEINISEIGNLEPLKFRMKDGTYAIINVKVELEGGSQTLRVVFSESPLLDAMPKKPSKKYSHWKLKKKIKKKMKILKRSMQVNKKSQFLALQRKLFNLTSSEREEREEIFASPQMGGAALPEKRLSISTLLSGLKLNLELESRIGISLVDNSNACEASERPV